MKKHKLHKKRILFISPSFFGYEEKIVKKLKELGSVVDFYDTRPSNKVSYKIIAKIKPSFVKRKITKHYNRILEVNSNKQYDYIFFIKADHLKDEMLIKYKEKFSEAKLILYLYDSINNIQGVEEIFKYFDKVLSFDEEDCKKHKELIFRPLFYGDNYMKKTITKKTYKYDLSFIGSYHSDRLKVLNKILEKSNEDNMKTYFYIYYPSRILYYIQAIYNSYLRKNRKIIYFKKLKQEEVSMIIQKSNTIIDIEHYKQTGLTMRTIEMIGMNKKLITTNTNIRHYDFYNDSNILIINRENPIFNFNFIENKYKTLDTRVYNYYSLSNWIEDIFG